MKGWCFPILPILTYTGGKSKDIHYFERYIPNDFDTYIEPFFGGGSLFFHLEPKKAVINDISTHLIKFYNDFIANPQGLIDEIYIFAEQYHTKTLEERREIYFELRELFNNQDYAKHSYAFLFYFLNCQCSRARMNFSKKGKLTAGFGYKKNRLITPNRYIGLRSAELLSRAEIYNFDFEQISSTENNKNFMFIDPPYISDTGYYDSKNNCFNNENEQNRLYQWFTNLRCRALMIVRDNPLYQDLYKDYIKDTYSKTYDVLIAGQTDEGKKPHSKAQHLIITNY